MVEECVPARPFLEVIRRSPLRDFPAEVVFREGVATGLGDDDGILETAGADCRVVKSGLNGDGHAGLERVDAGAAYADRRLLVNLETDAMAEAVEEAGEVRAFDALLVSGFFEVVGDLLVNLSAGDA